ncbi:hypothetical protein ACT91Q_18730 [Brevibacillus thermoruber]|uniref:hypothetical protein n=1 Tax=Brevibacillus thermoruber TaxID=33942 RepID=UPI0040415F06
MDRHELYKEMYYYELEQKEKINNRLGILIGILPVLFGAGFYCLENSDQVNLGNWTTIFYIILSLFLLSLVLTTIYIIRTYLGYKYRYLSLPSDIEQYLHALRGFYESEGNYTEEVVNQLISSDLKEFLTNIYIENTNFNMIENERKLQFLWRAGAFFTASIVCGALLGMLYFWGKDDQLQKPIKVQVVNVNGFSPLEKGGVIQVSDNLTNRPPNASQNPKPTPPKPRIINENFDRVPQRPSENTPPKPKSN